MSLFRATFLTETGALDTLYVEAPSHHAARHGISAMIGRHPEKVALVGIFEIPRTPRRRAETNPWRWIFGAMLTAGLCLLLLLVFFLHH